MTINERMLSCNLCRRPACHLASDTPCFHDHHRQPRFCEEVGCRQPDYSSADDNDFCGLGITSFG